MSSFLSRLISKGEEAPAGATLVEPGRTIGSAVAQMERKTQANQNDWGLGSGGSWNLDAKAARLTFKNSLGWTITAPAQIVGVLDPKSGHFIWAWGHPAVPDALAKAAQKSREFGEKYELSEYTTEASPADEDDAWEFTAVAAYLTGAAGTYRAPSGDKLMFLTFGKVSVDKG